MPDLANGTLTVRGVNFGDTPARLTLNSFELPALSSGPRAIIVQTDLRDQQEIQERPSTDTTFMLICNTYVASISLVTANEFKRWLTKQDCEFSSGKGGHLIVTRGNRVSVLPMHGKQKELGKGLVEKIKKDLGLK